MDRDFTGPISKKILLEAFSEWPTIRPLTAVGVRVLRQYRRKTTGQCQANYFLVSAAARYRSSDSTSAGSATVSAISCRKSSRYLLRSL